MKKEFEVISQIIQNNKRVLDIGCGDGALMEYLKVHQQNDSFELLQGIFEILDETSEIRDKENKIELEDLKGKIAFESYLSSPFS